VVEIKKTLQMGGQICYKTFNSFGEDDPNKQEEINNSQISQQSSLAKKEESPQIKDVQINHSKIVRDIEKKLN
jgi:hypothetical protein